MNRHRIHRYNQKRDHLKLPNSNILALIGINSIISGIKGYPNENLPTAAFNPVFYNILLIKNLKPEEQDFVCYKKTCQSWGLWEKAARQTLRGHHWPKYKVVKSNSTVTNRKRTQGKQTLNSKNSICSNKKFIFYWENPTLWSKLFCLFLNVKYLYLSRIHTMETEWRHLIISK